MKKSLIALSMGVLLVFGATAQVLPSAGLKNTVGTYLGSPLSGGFKWYGVVDTFQARFDINQFTVEGMLSWGLLTRWDNDSLDYFVFENTEKNGLNRHYYDGGKEDKSSKDCANLTQTESDSYYVNFLWHPFEYLDIGAGTKLNWQVGVAPGFGDFLWGANAHVRQGGFSTSYDDRNADWKNYQYRSKDPGNQPGTADVVGFVPYANKYAKRALGVRFKYEGKVNFEVGGAIPNSANTDNFVLNAGFAIAPANWFNLAFAYEGLFQNYGNMYAGASFSNLKIQDFVFGLDAYFAWDGINNNNEKEMAWSIGAAISFGFENVGLTIRPETAINFFEESNYLPAWYIGGLFDWKINESFALSTWFSFAVGSRDKTWDDDDSTKDWGTGTIVDLRPNIAFYINKRHTLNGFVDLEWRTAYTGKLRNCWSAGAYWTYQVGLEKMSAKKRK